MKILPWIKLKQYLEKEDYNRIYDLQEQCTRYDPIALKLELDYKLAVAQESTGNTGIQGSNEFLYFMGEQLIGYIGICSFGGQGAPFEVTGMVHPDYRRQGIFTQLYELVLAECNRRNSGEVLFLCDKASGSGQAFLKKIDAAYKYSEFEMYLRGDHPKPTENQLCGVIFRKAVNEDAYEIARQNAIYFGEEVPEVLPDDVENASGILLPEQEEKRGMTIYLAEKDGRTIGKVHLQIDSAAVGGIYGLGILPEFRGNGYGRAMLLRAIEKLKETQVKEIMLQVAAENAAALNLYKSCGFMETSVMDYFVLHP